MGGWHSGPQRPLPKAILPGLPARGTEEPADHQGAGEFLSLRAPWHWNISVSWTARRLDDSDAQRLFFLATLLYHAGRCEEAESYYRKVIDMVPDSGHGYLELVLFLESAGRREEAREVARRAIEQGALWADEWQRCPIYVKGGRHAG